MALERREYPVGKPCWSIHSNPIRGGSTKFMAMCGNGRKTVGTTTTLARLRMARLGHPTAVVTVSFAAVPGTSIRGSSARPSASGTPPTAETTSLGSVSGGRLPLESPTATRRDSDCRIPEVEAEVAVSYDARLSTRKNHCGPTEQGRPRLSDCATRRKRAGDQPYAGGGARSTIQANLGRPRRPDLPHPPYLTPSNNPPP